MRRVGARAGRHPSRDIRAAIAPGADADVQVLAGGIGTPQRREPARLLGRGREGKAGRSPRALSGGMGAGARENIEAGADARAGEAAPALHWSEMVAENLLHSGDGGAEILQ